MAQGIVGSVNELIASILDLFHKMFNTVYAVIAGALHTVYAVVYQALATVAKTVGLSIHLVTANITLIIVGLAVWFFATRTETGQSAASKAQAKKKAAQKKLK